MARSKYVYLVFHRWREEPLAAFTVKRESQEWAENSVHEMEDLYRVRMKDNPDTRNIDDGADCEWDARARSEHNTPPAFEKEGEGRGIRRIREEVKSEEEVKEVEEVEEVDPLLRDSPFKTSKDVQDFLFQLARAAVKGRDDWRVDRIEKEYGSSYYFVNLENEVRRFVDELTLQWGIEEISAAEISADALSSLTAEYEALAEDLLAEEEAEDE